MFVSHSPIPECFSFSEKRFLNILFISILLSIYVFFILIIDLLLKSSLIKDNLITFESHFSDAYIALSINTPKILENRYTLTFKLFKFKANSISKDIPKLLA